MISNNAIGVVQIIEKQFPFYKLYVTVSNCKILFPTTTLLHYVPII